MLHIYVFENFIFQQKDHCRFWESQNLYLGFASIVEILVVKSFEGYDITCPRKGPTMNQIEGVVGNQKYIRKKIAQLAYLVEQNYLSTRKKIKEWDMLIHYYICMYVYIVTE